MQNWMRVIAGASSSPFALGRGGETRIRSWMRVIAAAALLSAACGRPETAAEAGVPRFEADALPPGAAIWLKADLSAPKTPRLEVWAQKLSPVLGLAFHLTVDQRQLRVGSASTEPVMGLEARYLHRVRGGDVAFGLVHLGAASGQTALAAPTRLAVLQLFTLAAVDSRVGLERVEARTADGALVAVTPAAGRLVLP